ncbi:MAG: SulP family inorganic anion transporter [marine benthic group bacterium]|nr:SulP family inorganic anion transporter [Candidatus Benthicola marisminoris]
MAGVSVALVLVPQSMAYAELAGLPAHYGLYAAALPPIVAAFFASSPYLQTGPVALTSLLTLGALSPLAAPGTEMFVALAALLALVVGLARVIVGLVKEGRISYLMSRPVLQGFTIAAALLIVASQLPGALGVTTAVEGVVPRAWWALAHPESWEMASVVLAGLTGLLILGGRRIHPLVPGVLFATLIGIGYSVATGYTGPTVGEVPAGLPPLPRNIPWSQLPMLIIPGGVIALVGFAEAASISRTFAVMDRRPWDPDREFISQGVANLAAGLSSGFPVGGSFSRSSLNHLAGARSRWSGAITGTAVLLFLPVAGILAPLPRAVLSGIVIAAVLGLIRMKQMAGLWLLSKPQALAAWTTFALTLILAPRIDIAVLIGILLALGIHAWREMKVRCDSWIEDTTFHLAPRGVLWFGSAPQMQRSFMHELEEGHELDRIVLHLGGLGRIDLSGAMMLREFREEMAAGDIEVEVAGVPYHARRILRRTLDWEPAD